MKKKKVNQSAKSPNPVIHSHPHFFSPIHIAANWGPFPPKDADLIFECLEEIQKEDMVKKKIKQECRDNPEQQSIKKIGGKCKSSIPVRSRIGCDSRRKWGGPDSYATKKHYVKMKRHSIAEIQKSATGKLIPVRYCLYKVFNGTLFHVGAANNYYGKWSQWVEFLENNDYGSDITNMEALYDRAWRDDHRNLLFDGFQHEHLTVSLSGRQQCMYVLDTGESCLQDEFDAVYECAFDILREKYHVEQVCLDDLRDMCIRYYEPPEEIDMVTLDEDVSEHFNENKLDTNGVVSTYKKYAKKIEIEPEEVQNKKIADWPELVSRMAAKIEGFEHMTIDAVYVGKGMVNKLWRNRKNLEKNADYKWHPAIWMRNLNASGKLSAYSRAYVGNVYGFDIYRSESIADNETMITSRISRAWRGEVYYVSFKISI